MIISSYVHVAANGIISLFLMNGILVIKKNKIMPFAATWKQLESIILNEFRTRKTNTV